MCITTACATIAGSIHTNFKSKSLIVFAISNRSGDCFPNQYSAAFSATKLPPERLILNDAFPACSANILERAALSDLLICWFLAVGLSLLTLSNNTRFTENFAHVSLTLNMSSIPASSYNTFCIAVLFKDAS